MLDQIGVDVSDLDRSRAFYEAALRPLGYRVMETAEGGSFVMFGIDTPEFVIAKDRAPGPGNHIAFRAESRDQVDAFHAAARAASGRDNGGPGLRANYGPNYYAAFVIDPDGFNIEAVCRAPE